MKKIKLIFNSFFSTQKESKLRSIFLSPLCLLSFFYGWAVSLRIFLYAHGIFRSRTLPCKVLSVGNLTLGGTGKTPFACLVAEMIKAKGYRVAVLSRGYEGKFSGPIGLVSDGERVIMNAQQAGDEPYLLAAKLKGVPVIVGKNRWLSGKYAVNRFQTQVVVLDDGYQHLPLKRDLNFLLIDSSSPFGNGYLFPRGVLREPMEQMVRADALILTKVDQSANIKNLKEFLKKNPGQRPIFHVDYEVYKIQESDRKLSWPPAYLKGKRIFAFCGVARPESFRQTLVMLGAEIAELQTYPDHYEYGREEAKKLWAKAAELNVEALVTTEKDWVRMNDLPPGPIPLWVLSIRHFFPGNDQQHFEEFLFSRLGLGR